MIFTNTTYKYLLKSYRIVFLWLGSLYISTNTTQAQDIQFTQFYATNMYANPAFAGSSHMGRLISHSRYQWPTIDAKYLTSLASFDFFHPKTNSGIGVYVLSDRQGKKNISSNEAALMYSYELPVSEKFTLRFGIQGNYVSRYINYAILNFPDQFNNNGPIDNKSSSEPFGNTTVRYLDVSSGTVLYSKNFWASLAVGHINRPNQSFYNKDSHLPVKYGLTGGYKFLLRKKTLLNKDGGEVNLVPSVNYKFQGKSDQLDLGVYYLHNYIVSGIWYRGIPVIKKYDSQTPNHESFAALIGFKLKDFGVSYSYDFIVSKLSGTRPGGAHELNIIYMFPYPKKMKKVRRVLPCPDFRK
jgi:type IX secretion system PorP/SprF family membrane protein